MNRKLSLAEFGFVVFGLATAALTGCTGSGPTASGDAAPSGVAASEISPQVFSDAVHSVMMPPGSLALWENKKSVIAKKVSATVLASSQQQLAAVGDNHKPIVADKKKVPGAKNETDTVETASKSPE